MDDVDHALAARRHIEKADSANGDPGVSAGLAQAEALLAVAAALDRLADVFRERDAPGASTAQERTFQLAEIRKKYPNAYTPWSAEADAGLLAAHQAGHDVATLADTFGRQPSAIRSRLDRLGVRAIAPEPDVTAPDQAAGPVP
jgi:hypothetical protein